MGHLLQGVYLHVVVVLARQLHGQLTFGLETPIPQPKYFRGELQLLDREVQGVGVGWGRIMFGHKRWREMKDEAQRKTENEIGNGGIVVKVKTS